MAGETSSPPTVDHLSWLGSSQGTEEELRQGGRKGWEVDFEAVGGSGEVGPSGRGVGILAEGYEKRQRSE